MFISQNNEGSTHQNNIWVIVYEQFIATLAYFHTTLWNINTDKSRCSHIGSASHSLCLYGNDDVTIVGTMHNGAKPLLRGNVKSDDI